MKSRVSILTLFGLSFRLLKESAVTIGYFPYSFDLSCGKMSVLCCQWLSRRESLFLQGLVLEIRRTWLANSLDLDDDTDCGYLVVEQVSWENSWRNNREISGDSMMEEESHRTDLIIYLESFTRVCRLIIGPKLCEGPSNTGYSVSPDN